MRVKLVLKLEMPCFVVWCFEPLRIVRQDKAALKKEDGSLLWSQTP